MSTNQSTLVLIPGLLSDAYVWQPVADAFGKAMPVVIADVSAGISITKMAETILAENPGPLYVAGHSMGGRIALEMVRLEPDRVEKLALADTGVHPRKEGEEQKRQAVIDLAYDQGMSALAQAWLPPMVHEARHGDDDLMGALTAMVLRADAAQHERQIKALLDRPDAASVLPEIKCPVLLIVGRHDAWSPLSQHEEMLPKLANARLAIIEDAGHFAPIERPAETIEALRMWINGWDQGDVDDR